MMTAAGYAHSQRKLEVRFRDTGEVKEMRQEVAVECLRRLYERIQDPTSPDFAALTAVQERALYIILTQKCGQMISKANWLRTEEDGTEDNIADRRDW